MAFAGNYSKVMGSYIMKNSVVFFPEAAVSVKRILIPIVSNYDSSFNMSIIVKQLDGVGNSLDDVGVLPSVIH